MPSSAKREEIKRLRAELKRVEIRRAIYGPKVYICGNGRTEVYHSTESCAVMSRCTYQAWL